MPDHPALVGLSADEQGSEFRINAPSAGWLAMSQPSQKIISVLPS
jgi:hypothetical protein